jgi:protein MPE1
MQTHLLEHDFTCPKCGKRIASLDKVVMDKPTRTKVTDYIDKVVEESRKESEEGSSNTPPFLLNGQVCISFVCCYVGN